MIPRTADNKAGAWEFATNEHVFELRCIVKFKGVDKPDSVSFIKALKDLATALHNQTSTDTLLDAVQNSKSELFSQAASLTSTPVDVLSWVSIGTAARNDVYEYGFVLPFIITWSFTTEATSTTSPELSLAGLNGSSTPASRGR